ncbi:hypothetical protein ACWIYZ_03220 [Ursidibacter arcticus]
MSILTLDDVVQANKIFDRIYETFQQRVALFNFKLKRSPGMRLLKSVRNYENALNTLSKDEMFCNLWNEFSCIELGGELRVNALKNKEFISHCERLLDGSHEIFRFAQPLAHKFGISDIKLIKVVAEKLVNEITKWKYQAIAMTRSDIYQFDFCIADIRSVIEKCQALLDFDSNIESVIEVEHSLLHEWWNLIELKHATAKQLHLQ